VDWRSWPKTSGGKNGWAFGQEVIEGKRDHEYSYAIYEILEKEIIPLYYRVSEDGTPHDWVEVMKESIKRSAPRFSTRRMVKEYLQKFYSKALREV